MVALNARNPQAVLFACAHNSVRSPMAESLLQQMFPKALYVRSAGVRKGELDPFAVSVMAELGQDISKHKPITFDELVQYKQSTFLELTNWCLNDLIAAADTRAPIVIQPGKVYGEGMINLDSIQSN